jgi:hypothetical protein
MNRSGFESQREPTFYLFSKYSDPLREHPLFCSIGTGRYNRVQIGWGVMLTTTF